MRRLVSGRLCTWAARAASLALATAASAQIPYTPLNADPQAANAAFALQNPLGPAGTNYQVSYPYPGQCLADPLNQALFPTLAACPAPSSFTCPDPARYPNVSNQSAGGWSACGSPFGFRVLNPLAPDVNTQKFVWEVLNPPDYTPDTTTFPGADYYELGVHEAWGFQNLADLGAFPNPTAVGGIRVPNGMQWTGLTCNLAGGCTCPSGLSGTFGNPVTFLGAYCTGGTAAAPLVPFGAPLFTPIWGVGQINAGGTLGLGLAPTASPWSQNTYIATWPSVSLRSTKGRPVIVKWVNEFPNNHVLCTHPDAADWPCSIDRTFMGVKARIDPATTLDIPLVPAEGVNRFGSPQQPDNSWVTHLHGGEIPPSVDGFAEKWYGNAVTSALYTPAGGKLVNPAFENPLGIALKRPAGNFDTYTYPMVQEEATIWFHDHTLGKTHHNVIAGPAGFAPTKEPLKHGGVLNGSPSGACPAGYPGCSSEYTWVDPVTEIRGGLANLFPLYDLFLAIQDRAFNDDGSLNFSNGLAQTVPPPPAALPVGYTPVTSGVNPQVHPVWVPEYFGDFALVNGVLWPKKSTEPGWYRIRLVDGSDSRCYTIGFQSQAPGSLPPAPGAAVTYNTSFWVLANDQGYLQNPVPAPQRRITMCPGERYELLVNFGAGLTGASATGQADVYLVNSAPAPFPAGLSPQAGFAPDLNVLMKFQVDPAFGPGIKSCGQTVKVGRLNQPVAPAALSWDPNDMAPNTAKGAWAAAPGNYSNICMPVNPALQTMGFTDIRPAAINPFPAGTIVRQVYLNEKVDGVTLAPLGMQLNGVPFEYKVTETPRAGSREVWQFVNLTVDAHPMHPHLVKHQVVARQRFNVGQYKNSLCGSTTCQPGPAPGGEMQVIPDVNGLALNGTPFLNGAAALVTAASPEGGWKDTVQAPPGFVTTIVADWTARWDGAGTPSHPAGTPNAPGTAGCQAGEAGYTCAGRPASYVYETVSSGPYVWHCHINSHEDSEMMRTSLVVP
ncbi:MAG TPA: multicopper oxidase domain-containing protein [Anaeromyxobacteraceae bacterium]|nr:multicopper oxidase domain-containing protein [Anaeromyxobacteraceae bacterium]